MHSYLKCYYGYKNRWDELLFFGVFDWIKNNTATTHLTIEAWDVERMQRWCDRHKSLLDIIWLDYTIVDKNTKLHNYDLYFFGGGEVINDQDGYKLPQNPSLKHYGMSFLSKRFTRSWRNYYIRYYKAINNSKFILLWGIGKPYKITTKILYNKLLPKASQITTRDATSYQLARTYNPNTTHYHDFSQYMIDQFRNTISSQELVASSYPSDSYILINAQDHTWSDETLAKILAFVDKYPDKKAIYFPCDMQDDAKYFSILQASIPSLELYDRTKHSVHETLNLFAQATAWIGSRLHFLYPLHSFKKIYTSTATKDKVAKLLSPTSIDAI